MISSKTKYVILLASGSSFALAGILYLIRKISNNNVHKPTNTNSPPSAPSNNIFLGATDLVKAVIDQRLAYYLYDQHKKLGKIYKINAYGREQYVIADADEVHRILNNVSEFYRDDELQKNFAMIADSALFILPTGEGQRDQWHRHRKILSYGFSQTHLNHGFDEALLAAKEISEYWLSLNGKPFNLHYNLSCLALDVIGKVVFSQDLGAINALKASEEPKRYKLLKSISPIFSRRSAVPSWLWGIVGVAPYQVKKQVEDTRKLALDILKEKEKGNKIVADKDMDVLDRLLSKDTEGEDRFTRDEIVDEVLAFYLAGHGTSFNTMTFAILCLVQYPQVKQKLIAELKQELKGCSPSIQDLSKLLYLDAFIKEVLRLYPVAVNIARRSVNDNVICGYTIPKNSRLTLNLYAMQRGSWVWGSSSEEFNPDRFLNEYPKNGWSPFASGPTMCIGMRIALLEIKAVMATIVPKVDFELVPGQDLAPQSTLTLSFAKNGLWVKVKPRE